MIVVVIALGAIVLMIIAGVKQGYSAWAEEEAERRAKERVKEYISCLRIEVSPVMRVEFIDETKPNDIINVGLDKTRVS